MKILTISGSARSDSANVQLVKNLPFLFTDHSFQHYKAIEKLPLFKADLDNPPWDTEVLAWRKAIQQSDAVIISTPAYIYNIPALLKNGLEWVTSSGELAQKRVLPITFTPHPPRGKRAMQSLLWSLQALGANIVVQLPLYQNEIAFDNNGKLIINEFGELLIEAVKML